MINKDGKLICPHCHCVLKQENFVLTSYPVQFQYYCPKCNYYTTSYTSGKTLTQILNEKQDTLVSGTNIKTINGASILGTGDLTISGGSGSSIDDTAISTSTTYSSSKINNAYLPKDTFNTFKTSHETEYTTLNDKVNTFLGTDTTTLAGLKDLITAADESEEISTFTTALGNKANKDSVYTKTEIDKNYALKTDIPSLDGYATQTWVEDNGYLTNDTLQLKTINGTSVLGSGDITISGGSGGVTEDRVNELIVAYITANFEDGNAKEY